MKKSIILAAFAAALMATVSCNKEQNEISSQTTTKTLSLGFEGRTFDTKTYVKDPSAGTIWWGISEVDQVLYVFDDACTKYVFTSASTTPEATREFTCDTWPANTEPGFVVWSGKLASNTSNPDATTVDGDTIDGLVLPTTQYNDHASSFAYNTNIAVKKPGDASLRNVFGYIRYTVPDVGGYAAIKNVTIEADEFLAGPVHIDYSGADPVATIVGQGQKTVTADVNFNGGYEPGSYYMTVPAGTYHNVKITITPFASNADRTKKDAMAAAPFTLSAKGDVVVERGKYTDAGVLLYVDPNEEEEDDDIEWPTDPTAFDYGYDKGVTHDAKYPAAERQTDEIKAYAAYPDGIKGGSVIKDDVDGGFMPRVTLDRVTYYGPLTFNSNRWTTGNAAGPDVWMDFEEDQFDKMVPQNRCFSWKINRPGKFKYFLCVQSQTHIDRGVTYRLVLVKTVSGNTTAEVLVNYVATDPENLAKVPIDLTRQPAAHPESYMEFEVPKDALLGIDEAATLYFYAFNHTKAGSIQVHHFPIKWTPTAKEKLN